jgi:hypothetical protein
MLGRGQRKEGALLLLPGLLGNLAATSEPSGLLEVKWDTPFNGSPLTETEDTKYGDRGC